jgi:hypothetical protein
MKLKRMTLRMMILAMTAAGVVGCHGQLAIGGSDGTNTGAEEIGDTDGGNVAVGVGGDAGDGGNAATPTSGGAFTGAPGSAVVSALDDTEANALCEWLASEFTIAYPGGAASSTPTDLMPPGFAGNGAGVGAVDSSGQALEWTLVPTAYCVLNLRQGPCAATVSSLVACTQAFAAASVVGEDGSTDGAGLGTACDAFLAATSCKDTVFLTPPANARTSVCNTAVPIAHDAGDCYTLVSD